MQIRFYANLRTLVGKATLEVNHSNVSTLRALFKRLIELYPDIHAYLFDARDDLRQDVPIFVNGRNPRLSDASLDTSLEPDDVISLFSPISSGRMNVEVMREPAFGKQE